MYRAVRRHLVTALQPYQPGRSPWEAIAVVTLPVGYTAAAPRWSPGPEFVEISTASKWGRRTADGRLQAVVRSTDRHSDRQVLIRGALSAADLLGLGGITDKPHRLRWMALPGSLSEEQLTETHPAMLYDRWFTALLQSAQHRLALSGMPPRCCYRAKLTGRPDGRYQLEFALTSWSGWDDDAISRALTRITTSYGATTRLKIYRPAARENVSDPLYTAAWRKLQVVPAEFGDETFADRLSDLVERASAASTAP